MKKVYETPAIEKISLESKEVVCADNFFELFGISSGNDTDLNTRATVFEWSQN